MSDTTHVAFVERQMRLGVDVYLAEHDRRPGTPLANKILDEIRRADITVVLLTTTSANSAWVQQEIGAAKMAGRLVVPLVTTEVDHTQLGMLSEVEWVTVDFANPAAAALINASIRPLIDEHRRLAEKAAAQQEAQAQLAAQAEQRRVSQRKRETQLKQDLVAVGAVLLIVFIVSAYGSSA
jgi:hypothetical protein